MTKNEASWENATWEGSRLLLLKNSLKLTPQQRFEALEDLSETTNWLSTAQKVSRNDSPDYK
jgi:hypothetical protein